MSDLQLEQKIIEKFGKKKLEKAKEFPNNNLTLVLYERDPLKVRSIILENEREFHLIIDEEKGEIYHDCPTFLIYSEPEEKGCIHLIKLFLTIEASLSLDILNHFERFNLTSEDFGSNKKSTNYLLLAQECFNSDNDVEGLSYLNKAIISHTKCEPLIEQYLEKALQGDFLIEFFEFLSSAYENELDQFIQGYKKIIQKALRALNSSIKDYSYFNILKIIESLDKFFNYYDIASLDFSFEDFLCLTRSKDFKERYFGSYFILKYENKLIPRNHRYEKIREEINYQELKTQILARFFSEIDNLCMLDKLKMMRKHFDIFNIPKEKYMESYEAYKKEIKELEKKIYLKKFAFLKLLMKKYDVKKTKVNFRKKRNMYVASHQKENLENPAYLYIIRKIGFFGLNDATIKSSDLGINYFIIRELFLDDFTKMPDIFYYKNQYWAEEDYEIDAQDGLSLLRSSKDYTSNIDQKYVKNKEISLIEWDLAEKPRQGSIVNASGAQIIIPDQNNPLFHDLKPFDLCYIQKNPVKIKGDLIKSVNVISKCSFKDAIESVSEGISFIEGFYPLSLIRQIINKKISPFRANEIVSKNPNMQFVPQFNRFKKAFRSFLFEYINNNREYVFNELKKNPEENTKQIIILFNLTNEIAGLELNYSEMIKNLLNTQTDSKNFRSNFLNRVHSKIKSILSSNKVGATMVFDLKKMKHTPFIKYSKKIISIRKKEFETTQILKIYDEFDISEIKKTYYGEKFSRILNLNKDRISGNTLKKVQDFASKLNLKVNIKNNDDKK
ncbi:MAG: hypothetical protein BAJALOKI2v1_220017 [Promethearchaeota archaeon]|nr:MAG: hypothetical protein BAJALOKI2v1_220017 [Candidatus Lokiarchaeota archaeon]